MRTAIITTADHRYFPLLRDLIASIHAHRPDASLDICVLDVGITEEQKQSVHPHITRYVSPAWHFDFQGREEAPRFFQTLLARPFLPEYFPEYDRYVYLDSDLWLQDWNAMALLLLASERDVMAIVPEMHRAYAHIYRQNEDILHNVHTHYRRGFGETVGQRVSALPVMNAGVWAMKRDLPFWKEWAALLQHGLQNYPGFLIDQCALNVAMYTGKVGYYPLPAWCNWMCGQSLPIFDPSTALFHEPLLPHDQISILHLTEVKDREVVIDCVDGSHRAMRLTYSGSRDSLNKKA